MGATRRKGNEKLPKNVYSDGKRYVYKPYLGDGKRAKAIRLCNLDSSLVQIWSAYEKVINGPATHTISWLINEYLKSAKFRSKATRTQENYETYADRLKNFVGRSGNRLGDVSLKSFTTKTAQSYLDQREAKISANREIEFLSAAFTWGVQRLPSVSVNPCRGVDYNKEVPRDRYVTDQEYQIVYQLALKGRAKYLPILMELIYLCRARPNEIYTMKKSAIRDDGLFLERGKGSENEITGWSDRLESAVILALDLFPKTEYLLLNERGKPIVKTSFDSARVRLFQKAKAAGLTEPFTFHDLKAKGVSDHTDKFGGHRTEKMRRIYDRVPGLVAATR